MRGWRRRENACERHTKYNAARTPGRQRENWVGGEKERMAGEERRGEELLNHCVFGDYFSLFLQVVHRLLGGAAVSLRFTGSTFSLQNAFCCYPPYPPITTTTPPLPQALSQPARRCCHQHNDNTSKQ